MGNLLSKGGELTAKLLSLFSTPHPAEDDEFVIIGEDGQIVTPPPPITEMQKRDAGNDEPPEEIPNLGIMTPKISIGVPEELTGSQLPKPKSSMMSMDRNLLAEEVFLLPTFPRADLKEVRVKIIGQGAYSTVSLAKMKTTTSGKPPVEEDVAIKTLTTTQKHQSYEKDLEGFRGEVYILTMLKNQPFIADIQDYWIDDRGEHNIALGLVRAGNLKSILKKKKFFSEKQAKFFAAQLVLAMESLRAHSVVYRDLKPENVLVEPSGYIKLCDFGFSKIAADFDLLTTFGGTANYMAPEQLKTDAAYDHGVDLWMLVDCL